MKARKTNKEKRRFIPAEPFSGVPRLEMIGNREIIVDGCKGIVEYDENLIKLNAGTLVIGFKGTQMIIQTFDNDVAVIGGEIAEITFVT